MSWQIRRATSADADQIARIHVDATRAVYRGIYSNEYLEGLSYAERAARWLDAEKGHLTISDPKIAAFVAHNGGELLGFADAGPSRNESFKNYAELYAIYLDPDYIGQGIGTALFNTCVSHARQHGFDALLVQVLSKNVLACNFYNHMGGQVIPLSQKTIKTGDVEESVINFQWKI